MPTSPSGTGTGRTGSVAVAEQGSGSRASDHVCPVGFVATQLERARHPVRPAMPSPSRSVRWKRRAPTSRRLVGRSDRGNRTDGLIGYARIHDTSVTRWDRDRGRPQPCLGIVVDARNRRLARRRLPGGIGADDPLLLLRSHGPDPSLPAPHPRHPSKRPAGPAARGGHAVGPVQLTELEDEIRERRELVLPLNRDHLRWLPPAAERAAAVTPRPGGRGRD